MNYEAPSQSEKKEKDLRIFGRGEGIICLEDIFYLLRQGWGFAFVGAAIGLLLSIAFLAYVHPKYEAIAQISMAQITLGGKDSGLLGSNIEEPSALVARFLLPTSLDAEVLRACDSGGGAGSNVEASAVLANSIKITSLKGLPNIVELKTFGSSPLIAKSCAVAVFELIKTTQAQLVAPYINDIRIKLELNEKHLNIIKGSIQASSQTSSYRGAEYLSMLEELRYQLEERAKFRGILVSERSGVTRLVSPIYVSNTPVFPKKRMSLVVGLLGGLFLGFCLLLGRPSWVRFKNKLQG